MRCSVDDRQTPIPATRQQPGALASSVVDLRRRRSGSDSWPHPACHYWQSTFRRDPDGSVSFGHRFHRRQRISPEPEEVRAGRQSIGSAALGALLSMSGRPNVRGMRTILGRAAQQEGRHACPDEPDFILSGCTVEDGFGSPAWQRCSESSVWGTPYTSGAKPPSAPGRRPSRWRSS